MMGRLQVLGSSAADESSDHASQQSSNTRRESSSGHVRVEEVRTVSTGRNDLQRRRPTVQRSSSITTGQSNPAPRITRHHSVATADTSPPDQNRPRREGNNQGRPRMPHILIRGGYLQSQLDGPTIPVYTLQGSNEAYISLTDLPSLQMPSLDSVPAFIPELPEPVPDEEPPPYSPEPQRFSPRQGEGDSTLVNGEGDRGNIEDSNADDHVQVISQETGPTQDVGSDGEAAPTSGRSDRLPSTGRSSSQCHSSGSRPETNQPDNTGGTVEETSATSSVPKSVRRKTSGSQPHVGRVTTGGGRSTPMSDEPKSEESRALPDGKKISPKYGSVKEDPSRARKDRERLKEVGNIVSTARDVQHSSRIKTGDNDPKQNASKNKRGGDKTGGVKSGDKGGTRRKIPKVPDSNPTKIADKKQRIKDQVLMTEKSRTGRQKVQSESDDNSNKAHTKTGSLHCANLPETQIVTEKRENPSSTKNASGAKPKERRKQKGRSVQEVKNLEKNSNGSSHESLSEIVSLLESVKGGQEKKPKRKRSSALEEFNIPDSRV
ncbi:hypothetical protein HOLleu_19295 [Holothuria leucospilota]|uniref:Uncharacterized protein n=1 Tax=Holothuria leucospilota TaxID=206669 RepID=A0A9Q1BZS8_HOLLE|nr:hypothetical protein HOLleu_19295 [Holothuria leucospilota]